MRNKIFDHKPGSWKELEEMVYQAFIEMGYVCKQNYKLKTVRGNVKVDIYARKVSNPIPTIIICECKYWNSRITQSVIHSFRSVCSDAGAHYGLIVSKEGFQSGAAKAKGSTNIHLLDFNGFQDTYFNEWRSGAFMELVRHRDALLPFVNFKMRTKQNAHLFKQLKSINLFMRYSMFYTNEHGISKFFISDGAFPIEIIDPREAPNSKKTVKINSHREYFEIAKQACFDICKHFKMKPPKPLYKLT